MGLRARILQRLLARTGFKRSIDARPQRNRTTGGSRYAALLRPRSVIDAILEPGAVKR